MARGKKNRPVDTDQADVDQAENDTEAQNVGDTKGKVVIVDRARYTYPRHETKTASGRKAIDNDDTIANILRGRSLEDTFNLMRDNGININPDWSRLNPGLQRMAAGNVIRGFYKNSGYILVDGVMIKAPKANDDAPEGGVNNDAAQDEAA